MISTTRPSQPSRSSKASAANLPMSLGAMSCTEVSGSSHMDRTSSPSTARGAMSRRMSWNATGRSTVNGRSSVCRYCSIFSLLSKCGTRVSRSAPPTEL